MVSVHCVCYILSLCYDVHNLCNKKKDTVYRQSRYMFANNGHQTKHFFHYIKKNHLRLGILSILRKIFLRIVYISFLDLHGYKFQSICNLNEYKCGITHLIPLISETAPTEDSPANIILRFLINVIYSLAFC
jgi:hypothetical protein